MSDNGKNVPGWVKLTLLGVRSRTAAITFVVISLVGAVLCLLFTDLWVAAVFLAAGASYWFALRWMDANGGWDKGPDG